MRKVAGIICFVLIWMQASSIDVAEAAPQKVYSADTSQRNLSTDQRLVKRQVSAPASHNFSFVTNISIGNRLRGVITYSLLESQTGFANCWLDTDRNASYDPAENIVLDEEITYANSAVVFESTDATPGETTLLCGLSDQPGGDDILNNTIAVDWGWREEITVTIGSGDPGPIDPENPDPVGGGDPEPIHSIGSHVFLDLDNDGLFEPQDAETGIPDVGLDLYQPGPDARIGGGDDVYLASIVTSADGTYIFDNLLPGRYYVTIPAPPPSAPKSSDATDRADNQTDGDDNGDQPTGIGGPIYSPVIRLSPNTEPTGEDESFSGGAQDDARDDAGDMTIDFGMVDVETYVLLTETVPEGQSGNVGTVVQRGGKTDSYSLALAAQPSEDVIVTINADAALQVSPQSLVFTSNNWKQPQVVTVSAAPDGVADGTTQKVIAHSISSGDPRFSNYTLPDVVVTILDDDPSVEIRSMLYLPSIMMTLDNHLNETENSSGQYTQYLPIIGK